MLTTPTAPLPLAKSSLRRTPLPLPTVSAPLSARSHFRFSASTSTKLLSSPRRKFSPRCALFGSASNSSSSRPEPFPLPSPSTKNSPSKENASASSSPAEIWISTRFLLFALHNRILLLSHPANLLASFAKKTIGARLWSSADRKPGFLRLDRVLQRE